MPLIVERILTQKRCSMPEVELPFSGSPPNSRTLAESCCAASAQRSAFSSKKVLSIGFLTPSAPVRKPSSPSLQVSISSLSVLMTLSRSIDRSFLSRAAGRSAYVLQSKRARGESRSDPGFFGRLREPASLPLAGAELALIDDAGVLVAGGAEEDSAAHRTVRDPSFEAVGQVAGLVAAAETETHGIAVERALDRPLEHGRALLAAQPGALLLQCQVMGAAALQEVEPQFPCAGDHEGRCPLSRRRFGQRGAQDRDPRVADLHRLARLQLERIDRNRILAGAVVVEHDPGLAVEHAVAQVKPVQRVAVAVPDNLEPRHS